MLLEGNVSLTLSLRRCLWMTGLSTVILEEGKITGSFIKVYCIRRKIKKLELIYPQHIGISFILEKHVQSFFCSVIILVHNEFDKNITWKSEWNPWLKQTMSGKKHTWIGSRNSSGISPRVASASIASEAASLALLPRSVNSCIILLSSLIRLISTSAAAVNNWRKLQNLGREFLNYHTKGLSQSINKLPARCTIGRPSKWQLGKYSPYPLLPDEHIFEQSSKLNKKSQTPRAQPKR